jgi:hypothetical protein
VENFNILAKLIAPAWPAVLWLLIYYAASKPSLQAKGDPALWRAGRGLVAMMAVVSYLDAWHQELGRAWANYPLISSAVLVVAVQPLATLFAGRVPGRSNAHQESAATIASRNDCTIDSVS